MAYTRMVFKFEEVPNPETWVDDANICCACRFVPLYPCDLKGSAAERIHKKHKGEWIEEDVL